MYKTTLKIVTLRKIIFFLICLLVSINSYSQFYTTHYIAPAPWNYYSDANALVISTQSTSTVNVTIKKSDGTTVATISTISGSPAVYRFAGNPVGLNYLSLNTVLTNAGLIITSSAPTLVNLRNIASDNIPNVNGNNPDKYIKGNASLTSYGNPGIGIKFRVGYYRNGTLGPFQWETSIQNQLPTYSVMAIVNNTVVKLNGTTLTTLQAGQSYLFKAAIGSLVETSAGVVMNTGAILDNPDTCGDGTLCQIPPVSVLGKEYFLVRTQGSNTTNGIPVTSEQSTIVASEANTVVTISKYALSGSFISSSNITLVNAGDFYTFYNGDGSTPYSANRILSDKKVAVFTGSAQLCEVDISAISPTSACGGSYFVETSKFKKYDDTDLTYFGYVLIQSATAPVNLNGSNIETAAVGARRQLGNTGWYLIDFTSAQINTPNKITISSTSRIVVSLIQQGGGFSMSAFFSNFVEQPNTPTVTYKTKNGCSNGEALLTADAGFGPYQWYLNGVAISGATSNTYTASQIGAYTVAATLSCGEVVESPPVNVDLCTTDIAVIKVASNETPYKGGTITFTITAQNLSTVNNASNVVVSDVIPSGYTLISATPSAGTISSSSTWTIGTLNKNKTETLTIVATVNLTGNYANTATITTDNIDPNPYNNTSTSTPVPINTPIDAIDDAGTTVNGFVGGTSFTNVLSNDTLNGVLVDPTKVNTTFVSSTNAGITLSGTNVVVAAGTPAGNYSLVYKICEVLNPTNCDPATVTVPVSAAVIDAINDTGSSVNGFVGGTSFTNVLSNDTLNGVAVVGSKVNTTFVSSTNAGITLSGTNVLVAAGTPAGNYSLVYKICEVLNPTNCDPATVTVPVSAAVIDAINDTGSSVNGFVGGTSLTNVLSNDTLNGSLVDPTKVTTTFVSATNTGITLSGTNVVVAAGTPAGNYSLVYQICEKLNPTNCDQATVTVTVTKAVIDAIDDAGASVNGFIGGTSLTNVLSNDTLNGSLVDPTKVTTTFVSATNTGITLSGTNVVVAAGTPAGNYSLVYQICEKLNPTNCDQATVTVTVTKAVIDAIDDAGASVNGFIGGTSLTNVLSNDTLNGSLVDPTKVTTTFVSATNTGITLSGTNVVVAAGTPAGNYSLVYQICEKLNPTNCDQATVTVTVTKAVIDAIDDAGASVNGFIGGTSLTNVLSNDTLNGSLVDPTKVTTTFVSATNTGITLSGTNVVVAAGTPAGNYSLVYQICEKLNPTNCDQATVTVTVTKAVIDAIDDTGASVNGFIGGTSLTNVLSNDTLNGSLVDPTKVTTTFVSATNTGITLSGTNVVVAAGTPAGNYSLVYQICEKLNPTNCDQATVTVTVTKAVIDAIDDAGASVNGFIGGTSLTNVLSNDTLNGSLVDPTKVTTTFVSATNTGITLSGTNVVVAAGTPAGNYSLVYQICEKLNPTNCDQATVTVTVTKAVIDAIDDTGASVNGFIGGTSLTNVLSNDTLNGSLVDPTKVTTTFVSATNTGITLSGTNVVVAAGTPAGNYSLVYQICEKLNPTNCDQATVTVTVTKAVIDAIDDAGASVNGFIGGTSLTNVLSNDTLNGALVDPTKVTTTFVSATNTGITLSGTNVVVAAGTPAGNYSLVYQICEKLNPTNCDQATVTVTVTKAIIDAIDDAGASVNGFIGGTSLTNVLSNDTLNGSLVDPTKVTTTFVSATNTGITLSGTNVVVAAGTPAGNYSLVYQICEKLNPTNCDQATVTVTVTKAVIDAIDDAGASVNGFIGGTSLTNVLSNDTLNGSLVDPTKVTTTFVSATNTGITLSGTNVVVAAGTPAGNYSLVYQICEKLNPTNCDQATVTVTVTKAVIDAIDDAGASVNGFIGGTSLTNVLSNDTLNGSLVDPTKVTTTFVSATNTGITLSGTNVVVAAGTPAGNYSLVYQICEKLNPTNCDQATVTVTVTKAVIDAIDDAGASVNGFIGGTSLTNVLSNDTLNGSLVDPTKVTTTFVSATNTGITLSGTNVVVAAGTPAGNYSLVYQICEKLNPTNCDQATVTVTVTKAVIDAIDDAGASVNGFIGGTSLTNVLSNDTLNGSLVDPTKVTTTFVSATNTGITLSGTNVVVAAGTPAGNYSLVYQICEKLNPTNCDQATVTVTVTKAVIDAIDDAGASVNGFIGGTSLTNVLSNDTLNGSLVDPTKVTTTFVSATNTGITLSGTNVVVAAGTPAGNYSLVYQICEKLNPTNCDQATVTVTVTKAVIDAIDDAGASVNGFIGGTSLTNVLSNDTLNGSLVDPTKVTTTFVSATNTGITLSGTNVVVAAGTPAGNYSLVYQICEKLNPTNCDQATVTVTVTKAIIDAIDDAGASVNGFIGGTSLTNVLSNDTLNGSLVDPTKVTTTFVSATNTGITLSGTNVVVAAGTPAGNYSLVYQICEKLNPTNCDQATVTVTVTKAIIDAIDDAGASVNGFIGGTSLTNVLSNDTLNGSLVDPTKVTTTFVSATNTGITLSGTNVVVAAGTPAGNYSLVYQICEKLNPTNCDQATVTVTVTKAVIDAIDDAGASVNGFIGGTSLTNVLSNDTLNGSLVDPTKVTTTFVSATNTGITLSGTNVVVAAGTPAGNYSLVYQICEKLNPTNCDQATVTVTVTKAIIDAIDDAGASVNGFIGGTSLTNVLSNDTLNGSLVDPTKVTTTFVSATNTGITLSGTNVVVAAGTPAGNYSLVYQICEKLNPTNCDQATVTVTVTKAIIDAIDDAGASVNGFIGGTSLTNVLSNDTLNGSLVDPTKVTTTFVSATNTGITLSGTNVVVAAGTPAGNYSLVYQICEKLNPSNCDTATVTVTVGKAIIDAIDDVVAGPINGKDGGDAGINVLTNDTLNGVKVVPADVVITSTATTALSVNTDGSVSVAAGTPAGEYTIQYTICEKLNPSNCDTATVTVTVGKAIIDAIDDVVAGPINGKDGGDAGINVLDNDTLNGVKVVPADVVITSTATTALSVNTDGSVSVAAGTPAGEYTIQYTICEKLNPSNCDTATVTVTVGKAIIDAIDDVVAGPINGKDGGDAGINVLTNDTLNGVKVVPADVVITSTATTALIVNTDGSVSVAAGTPAGEYTIQYTICEKLNPSNCDTATVTVTVGKAIIDAIDDVVAGPINGKDGGDAGINVLDNDTLNGVKVVPADVVITSTATTALSVNTDGSVSVAAGTPAGEYTIQYTICEKLNPSNCDTATVTVTVGKAIIDAIDDVVAGPINGKDGGDAGINVLDNDTLNGVKVVPADVVITSTATTALSVNTDGSVSVAAGTPAGEYTIQYTICEKLNPSNCDTATVTVTVGKAIIDAIDDVVAGPINGKDGGDAGINVLDNDTLNGVKVVPADVVITSTATTALSVNTDGSVSVAAGTPAGEYTIQYTICEKLNPSNCDTATVTVTVGKAIIDAIDDVVAGPINGKDGGDAGINVLTNDTLNGVKVVPADVVITSTATTALSVNTDGSVSVAAGTPAGEYTIQYTICEKLNPSNCDTATVTVTVGKAIIDAIDDVVAGPINGKDGGDAGINVLDNDTLNGVKVVPADVVITSTATTALSVNTDGSVSVAAGTPAGEYTIQYTICEKLNPSNCDTATVTVTVGKAIIDAIDDVVAGPINGKDGGDAGINVLTNDTLNGVKVVPADVVITSTATTALSVNTDGSVSVAAGTPAGEYTIQYTICEKLNPSNCDTATVTVTVGKAIIDAIDDVVAGPINGKDGGDAGINVLTNDTLNGVKVVPADVVITSTATTALSVNTDGTVSIAPNTPAGEYTIQYTICEKLNPSNCDTATVTVTVGKAIIDAIDDVVAGPINGKDGGDAGINVLDNDTLNGVKVVPADVVITSTATTALSVNTDGSVSVAAGTPAGEYTIQYTICEKLNPSNCDTATVTVTVGKAIIDAIDDVVAGPINGKDGGDAGINVLTNDTLNGVKVVPADVVITSTATTALSVNTDGSVSVAAGTPAGEYTIQYTICEKLNPSNCDTATVTVTVGKAIIDAIDDVVAGPINGKDGGDAGINVLDNDTLNGVKVVPADVVITSTATTALSVNTDGSVSVAAGTPAGEYTIQYTICEKLNPSNCDTATVTVTVGKAIIDAIDDVVAGPINGKDGGDAGINVLTNDTLNGVKVVPADVVITSTATTALSVNTDGSVSVAAGTPAGEYTIQYTICEKLNPSNCDTATVTVTVGKAIIDAIDDVVAGPINGKDGGDAGINVLTNDTLNGVKVVPADVVITSTATTALSVNTDGSVSVAAGTPAGEYTIQYTICEKLNPSNCDTATVTVTVGKAIIDAIDDVVAGPINGKDGGDAGINVLDNDTLNGVKVVPADVVITSTATTALSVNTDGSVSVAAGTPAGEYTIQYTICEKLNPSNCDTATVTVTVGKAIIDAIDDVVAGPINGKDGGDAGINVLTNDTLNGVKVVPADVVITSTATTALSVNTDGSVSVAAGTPAGEYTIQYTICEKLNPSNCDTATVTVTVGKAIIDAIDDVVAGPINGKDGGDAGINVLDNDTLNGVKVVPADVVITSTATTALSVNTDGSVSVAAGTPAGEYTIQYTICEKLNPSNCDTATVTVTVGKAIIDAIDDVVAGPINGKDGGDAGINVLTNDTLNGVKVVPADVVITSTATTALSVNTDGSVSVAAGTPAGEYTIQYTICEKLNPSNCDTATVTVTVGKAIIDAIDDVVAGPINGKDGGDAGINVLTNDTLNGVKVVPADVVITSTATTALSVNTDGSVSVAAGTPAGEYTIQYTICEKLNPSNCDTATVTVTVGKAIIDAIDDVVAGPINGKDGGDAGINVLTNDTLNGVKVVPADVVITSTATTALSVNTDGSVSVAAGTPAGEYTIQYTICEKLNPSNCDTATVTVTVGKAIIDAIDDVVAGPINGKDGGDAGINVLDNDTLNGVKVVPADVVITSTATTALSVNTDGSVSVAAGTPAGEYTIQYTICEKLNPSNCDTATVTVTVGKAIIDAIDDVVAGPINGKDGGDAGINVLTNDTLNGVKVVPADVVITSTATTALSVNTDGSVSVAAGTPAGEYTIQYTICEKLNPSNCDTATVTVTVGKAIIDAIDDVVAGPINGKDGGDAGINVLDNDTLNGVKVVPADVVITSTATTALSVNTDGSVSVAAGTPAGEYTIQYTICEKLNPSNCDTATVTVTVGKAIIDAIDDVVAGPINGKDGGDAGINVLTNDTLNGVKVVPADVVITSTATTALSVNTDGSVSVAAGTPAGEYTIQYTICEKLNPSNCDTATVTVTVGKAIIDAIDDVVAGPINGKDGGDAGINVLTNDTLNGVKVVPADVVITSTATTALSVNTDGSVSVAAGTPAGEYTIQYTICEKLNPSNCDTATVTVTVGKAIIDAIDDVVAGPINGKDGGDAGINVLTNDTLNGVKVVPADVVITSTATTALSVNTDGSVSVAAGTPAGEYTIQYTICEKLNPSNCDTATVTVTVGKAIIDAIDDVVAGPINGKDGGDAGINVLDNDTLNGVKVVPADVVITSTATTALSVNTDGSVSVAAGTPAGEYTIQYTICEKLNPSNCDTATVTVTVGKAIIDAIDDVVAGPINGKDGGDAGINVLTNDTLNGVKVVPADVVITSTATTALSVNTDGSVSVAAGTPAGEYTIQYTICEKLNPSNCDTATVTVTVGKAIIDAIDDVVAGPINGKDGGDAGINVLDNDTLNGVKVVPADVVITSTATTALSVNTDGSVSVAAGTPAGEYTIQYTICEKLNPSNCDTATVTVTVGKAIIDAIDDVVAGPINGKDGGDAGINVLDNDTLNGVKVVPADVVITSTATTALSVNTDGSVSVAAGTPAGEYTIQYTICEKLNPSNCDTATVTVTVGKAIIDAIDDVVAGPINGKDGGDAGINVLINDTLNGVKVVPADVVITSTATTALSVNTDGSVSVAAGTPAGEYTIQYTICEKLNPSNCDTATVTVHVVAAPIDAVSDIGGPINGATGGTVPSVLTNDTLNGVPVNPSDVVLTSTPNGPLTVNADGTVSIAPNTPAGDYTVPYTICEVLNPTNCDTATVTVHVVAAPIDAVSDNGGPINGATGGTVQSVLTNDTLNGVPVKPSDVVLTSTPNGPLTVNADGTVSIAPNTPAGDYTVPYTICEVLNPTNCDTATVTVHVVAAPIDAVADVAGPINGTTGGIVPSVLTNDTLNGVPVNPSDVVLISTPNGPLTINADGTVSIAPNTPAGDYTVPYTICEVLNPTNCDTATVTVHVVAAPIDAVADVAGPINGTTGGTVPSVLTNDTLNGVPVNPSDVVLTSTPNGPLTVNADGTVSIAPNTPAGDYTVTYTICEVLNPTNCDTATVTVTVAAGQTESPSISIIKTGVFNDSNNDGFAQVGETISYSFLITNTGNMALSNVTVTDNLTGLILTGSPIVSLGAGETNNTAYSGVYPVTLRDIQLGLVTNYANVTGSILNGTIVKDDTQIETKLNEEPIVLPALECVIEVFNAVSPNGDGNNDFFRIDGLECYPENKVEIYNRWGVLVFERVGYNNTDKSFKGFSEGRVTISQSEGLPTGTYYYILKYKDNDAIGHEKAGYLYLNR
ncbi:gliding motility-associated C-terminal domain-containing protein [Flavobacterium sp. WC2416]|uniref:Gliding motility-associated C-terminal domain-containing protein n=1 Tax=Flavobacterium sp. WC2416 TaxID=3234141 RepID=A0AB39WC68_9FLAO